MTRDLPDTPRHGRRKRRAAARPAALAAIVLLSACALLAAPSAGAQEPGVRREDGLVFFNLQNVDIRSALESISEVLGISYVLGGSVPTGTPITISTAAGIAIEKVPDLLDSVLRTYSLALIKTGDVFTVIQAGEAGAPTAEAARTQVYVYYLRNANAVDLANVLTQLFQGTAPAGGFTRRSQPTQGLSRRLEQQTLPYAQAQPYGQTEGEGQVAQPEQQAPSAVTRIIPGELVGQTFIVPDETTNSLIIKTAPENYASLEETIGKLDVRPPQVLIEVTIAEITLDKSTQFGIEYLLRAKATIAGETVRGELELSNTTPFQGGLRGRVFDSENVNVTLRALAADSRVNVLSTPRVLAVNNHEARILIGSEVPFVQFSRATTGEAIDQVVQYRNVGLELTVTPRINHDRYISMDLLQQVSALSNDVLFDAPIITTREAQTSLVVGDNQTVVLGGLMEERKEKRRNGIPILKDIPVLGWLFGSTSERTVKTELVLTLTPYIVESDAELQGLRREIETHSELYGKELERRREKGHFVPGDLTPERLAPPPGGTQDGLSVPAPAPADTTTPAPAPADSLAPLSRKDSRRGGAQPSTDAAQAPSAGQWPAAAQLKQGVEVPAAGDLHVTVSGATVLPSGSPEPAGPEATVAPKAAEPAGPEAALAREGVATVPEPEASGNADAPRDLASARGVSEMPGGLAAPAAGAAPSVSRAEPAENQASGAAPLPGYGAVPAGGDDAGAIADSDLTAYREPARQSYRVQVTAVPQVDIAQGVAERLRQVLGMDYPVYMDFIESYYKVRVGDFPTKKAARELLARLRRLGYEDAWTVLSPTRSGGP